MPYEKYKGAVKEGKQIGLYIPVELFNEFSAACEKVHGKKKALGGTMNNLLIEHLSLPSEVPVTDMDMVRTSMRVHPEVWKAAKVSVELSGTNMNKLMSTLMRRFVEAVHYGETATKISEVDNGEIATEISEVDNGEIATEIGEVDNGKIATEISEVDNGTITEDHTEQVQTATNTSVESEEHASEWDDI